MDEGGEVEEQAQDDSEAEKNDMVAFVDEQYVYSSALCVHVGYRTY